MEFVDTHCHLQFEKYTDPDEVVSRAESVGVTRMVSVGTTLEDSSNAIKIADKFDSVWASVGIHPHEAGKIDDQPDIRQKILDLLSNPKVVAVGEIGLDYFKNYSPKEDQIKTLHLQLDATIDGGLPYIFHVRQAWKDFWRVFDEYKNLTGVIHSFSTTNEHLEEALSRGLFIGLNGIMTFTKDQAQLEAARQVPLDKLLLETDAPFLAPEPFRNQVCEPQHVVTTAEFLAGLRDESIEELAKTTTANAQKLFNLS
ncbi:TatD family hydrolase [Candidatus Saccharibacteria bacterium]|nr:TatD family hydrolase [Candidatus Saccharibacteria bacterium]